ncbi:hypothetical protein [Lysinibacillus fusiformis]|uniref:hypothetical protein n=1 Tax=Lysinibacillus fusiformis TaxID=28031 RepID=UPI001EF44F0A|nr:hypothetical protein [Lysinibacillus fusiformis]MCG7435269.1 hypothetical protein [Lysinibacillus fusiformis]
MANFINYFLSLVIGLTAGILIINNPLNLTNRVFLLLILLLATGLLIMALYRNHRIKLKK